MIKNTVQAFFMSIRLHLAIILLVFRSVPGIIYNYEEKIQIEFEFDQPFGA
jgi:hypothetical protein